MMIDRSLGGPFVERANDKKPSDTRTHSRTNVDYHTNPNLKGREIYMQYAAIVSLVQNISSVFSPLLLLMGMDRERMSRRMRRRTDGQWWWWWWWCTRGRVGGLSL